MLQVAAIFSQYDDAVLLRATDPFRRDCLQQTSTFPPSCAEIRKALDNFEGALAALSYVAERESRGFFRKPGSTFGFFNAAGEKYDPKKHRNLPRIGALR